MNDDVVHVSSNLSSSARQKTKECDGDHDSCQIYRYI